MSRRRLMSLLQRLQGEPEVLKEYDAVIKDQLSRGIAEIVDKEDVGEIGKVHYIPHHGVIRRDKQTTKLRIVYDASAKSSGPSLNDCLYTGPAMTHNIMDIILRFRSPRISLSHAMRPGLQIRHFWVAKSLFLTITFHQKKQDKTFCF